MYAGEASPFRQTPKSCMAYPPWIALFSAAVVVAGLCVFAPNGIRGVGHINDGLKLAGVAYKQHDLPRKVCGALMAILLLISVWRSVLEAQRDNRGYCSSAGAYLTFNAIFNFLFWCTVAWTVLAFGVLVTATAASYATDRGLVAATSVIQNKLILVRDSIDSARNVVALADASVAGLSPTLASSISNLKKLVGSVSSVSGNTTTTTPGSCPFYCLDLSELKFLTGNPCICTLDTLTQARVYAKKAVKDLIPAIIGLLVAFVGSTWLLMNVVAQFSHTRADARWSRRIDTLIAKNPAADNGMQYQNQLQYAA